MSLDANAFWTDVGAAWMSGDVARLDAHLAPTVAYHMPPVGDFDRAGLAWLQVPLG